ncbi:phosphopantetheine-binding protein [Streptomyces sp. NPDC087300]|uniref:phosphopantetheine-binding protein n=1 Tax=Streptomyces sp. NPDC087300 TaxID=3365780 RepID=UPI0037F51268
MPAAPWPPDFENTLRLHLPLLDEDRPLSPELVLSDHGLDSLATVSLLLDLEERYAVTIPDELLSAQAFGSPAELWAVVALARGGSAEPAVPAGGGNPS